jgi:galactose mutarotase-like enzyme
MSDLHLNIDETYLGLRVITLDNGLLRLQILPEAGAKIWQITYLPLGVELLWNNPLIPPAIHAVHAQDEETVIGVENYPDHGELWSGNWDAEPFSNAHEVGVKLRFQTPVSRIAIEKTITLRRDHARVYFTHRFTNLGAELFPFLWKLHPAFNVSAQHRLDFQQKNLPAGTTQVECHLPRRAATARIHHDIES